MYNAALQHDDHRTRQKLEKGWQQGMMQGVRMTCAAMTCAVDFLCVRAEQLKFN